VLGKVGVNSGLKLSHRREASPANGLGGDTSKEASSKRETNFQEEFKSNLRNVRAIT
jgi:hypothetical protein